MGMGWSGVRGKSLSTKSFLKQLQIFLFQSFGLHVANTNSFQRIRNQYSVKEVPFEILDSGQQ